ncbi:hypothetical protein J1N35_044725 [Gossypium stocksii]|uniref:Uncharacterized protein n=1 Tax=Gossypium stocksii TaxID=47602 RepID=A0A9D3UA22_9ROSI|nr:hypothetical protein J1N35_044725 [Gossypium stocksii]
MCDYITKIKEVYDTLTACENAATKVEQIATILNGLPSEYDSFVIIITVSKEPYDLESVISGFMDFQSRLRDSLRVPLSINNAQFTVNNFDHSSGKGRGQYNNRLQCQLCGKLDHLVDWCFHCFDQNFAGVTAQAYSP